CYQSCCRISTLQNNRDGNFYGQTTVTVGNSNDAPVSTVPPIIAVPTNTAAATYQIPAADPDNDAITFSLAPNGSFGTGTVQPSGFSVSSSGLITFNTVGKAVGSLWSAAVDITDSKGAKSTLDLIIKVTNPSTPPFFDYTVTPNNNAAYLV